MSEFEENQLNLTQLSVEETEEVSLKTEMAEGMEAPQDGGSGSFRQESADQAESAETIQSEDQPMVVDMSAITASTQERENLSKFQHIVDGFFAQTKEPALTISGKTVTVNAAAVRLFPTVDYMEILINTEDKKVAFEPCTELNIRGYKWARDKDGKRYSTTRTGLPFVLCICQIMNWDPNKRYKIRGKKVLSEKGEEVLVFDLHAKQEFEKPAPGEKGKNRSTILTGWNGVFGPMYNESESNLQIDTFDGYAFFSIKDGWVQNHEAQVSMDQGSEASNEAEDEE